MSMQEPRDPRLLRVSHADRDRVVEILREAAGDGRLDAEELDERVGRALEARTFAELEPLTQDLPVPQPVPPHLPGTPRDAGAAAAQSAAPADAVARQERDRGEAVSWSVHGLPMRREGAWTVPRVIDLDVHGGTARLDYTLARLPQGGSSEINVSVHGGSLRLILPPGVAVDASGVSRHGGSVRDRSLRYAGTSEQVTHVITVRGEIHGGSIKVLPVGQVQSPRRERLATRRAARRRRWYGDA